MIVDGRTLPDATELAADVCIVGGGAAGIAIALELAQSPLKVLLIEAGGRQLTAENQALYQGFTDPSDLHPPPSLYRQRLLGGSTSTWGGRCVPFDPIDFEQRDYVPLSEWPLRRGDIAPYYARAMRLCDAGAPDWSAATSLAGPPFIVDGFRSPAVSSDSIERFSRPTNFGRRYAQELERASRLTVLTDTTCIRVRQNGSLVVEAAECATFAGTRLHVRAAQFVIAVGGLETVRVLGISDTVRHNPNLGRHYMCHIEGTLGTLRLLPASRHVNWAFERTSDAVYARRRFSIAPEVQRSRKLLNFIARLHHENVVDPRHRNPVLSAMFLTKQLIIPEYRRKFSVVERSEAAALHRGVGFWGAHIRNVVLGSPALMRFASTWFIARNMARRRMPAVALFSKGGIYPLDYNAEQVPNYDSRVYLRPERDRLDIPKLHVAWRMTETDAASIAACYRILRDEFAASDVARLEFDDATLEIQAAAGSPVGGHHIGTARIAPTESTGVVDGNCRVFGTSNLYIAGAAVFPTSSHANPTLTLLALALRLADHLKDLHAPHIPQAASRRLAKSP